LKKVRSRLTFANLISCLALFVALGGASYAATQLPKNSIGSKQIKKGSIQLNDLSKGARSHLAGAVGARGPVGQAGHTGQAGPVGPAGPQTSTLASGQTLRGVFNMDFEAAAPSYGLGGNISFGLNLPQAPQVTIVDPETTTPNCPGSVQNPQAARGFLCVYESSKFNTETFSVCDAECETEGPAAEAWGAELYLFAEAKGRAFVNGAWATTAP
jgi:hypothetical protein